MAAVLFLAIAKKKLLKQQQLKQQYSSGKISKIYFVRTGSDSWMNPYRETASY